MVTMQMAWRPLKKSASYFDNGSPMTNQAIRISVAGENSLIVYFSEHVDAAVATQIQACSSSIRLALGSKLIDLVASYASILVIYDGLLTDHFAVSKIIRAAATEISSQCTETSTNHAGNLITLPVYYSIESGPDLASLAEKKGLTTCS